MYLGGYETGSVVGVAEGLTGCGRIQGLMEFCGKHPSAAEADAHFKAFMARLKSCPFKIAL